MDEFLGVITLESVVDLAILDSRVTVLKESEVIWTQLVRIPKEDMVDFARDLASTMCEEFYNHFVNDEILIVVFKERYFTLNKHDHSSWQEMIDYGETVGVGVEWTTNIPVDETKLL